MSSFCKGMKMVLKQKCIEVELHKLFSYETFLSTPFDDLSWSKLNSPNMGKF